MWLAAFHNLFRFYQVYLPCCSNYFLWFSTYNLFWKVPERFHSLLCPQKQFWTRNKQVSVQLSCLIHALIEKQLRWQEKFMNRLGCVNILGFPPSVWEFSVVTSLHFSFSPLWQKLQRWIWKVSTSFLPPVSNLMVILSNSTKKKKPSFIFRLVIRLFWAYAELSYQQATVTINFTHSVLSILGKSSNFNPDTFIQYSKPGTVIQPSFPSRKGS